MRRLLYTFLLVAAAACSSCLKEAPLKQSYNGFSPLQRTDGWLVSTPEAEQMDPAYIDAAFRLIYEDDRFLMARSMLIIRNGKLVAEAYPHDSGDIDRIANIQSCTKTFTGILTGIALHEGHIDSVKQKLSDIYPQHFINHQDKKDITIEDALTMRTGLSFDNSDETLGLYNADNSVDYVLSKEKLYEPGVVMHYNDGAPQLMSAAMQTLTGQTLGEYANQKLFAPLGITDWLWEQGADGVTFGAFSLYLKPRDLGKVAQLLLQNGNWNNQQLVDSAWIASATKAHVSANFDGAPYGYYFWVFPAYNGYGANGHGGQVFFVVPEKNLVLVYTAWGYTNSMFWDEATELMDLVLKSCD